MPHPWGTPQEPLPESVPADFGIAVDLYGWIMTVLAIPGYELPEDTAPAVRRAFNVVRHEIYKRLRENVA